jgi:hypothetical protein
VVYFTPPRHVDRETSISLRKILLAAAQVHTDPLHGRPEAIRNDYQQHEQDDREFRVRTCHAFYTSEQNDSGAKCRSDNEIRMVSSILMRLFLFVYLFYPPFFILITVTPFLLTETGDLRDSLWRSFHRFNRVRFKLWS